MKGLQHKRLIMRTVQKQLHDLREIPRGGGTEVRIGTQDDRRLREALSRLHKRFEAQACALEKRRCTSNERLHWQTRGRQQILRVVAGHLREMSAKPWTAYALFVVLKDYIGCLEKYAVDAEEEKNAPISGHAWPIQQWKARGIACEVPSILAALKRLLSAYAPPYLEHILAPNGCDLIPLLEGEEDTNQEQIRFGVVQSPFD